jgi:hypothetical protein
MEKYRQLVYDSCHKLTYCTSGHKINIPCPKGAHQYSDRVLNPLHYEKCRPTPQIYEAFEIDGKRIFIDPESHYGEWKGQREELSI